MNILPVAFMLDWTFLALSPLCLLILAIIVLFGLLYCNLCWQEPLKKSTHPARTIAPFIIIFAVWLSFAINYKATPQIEDAIQPIVGTKETK